MGLQGGQGLRPRRTPCLEAPKGESSTTEKSGHPGGPNEQSPGMSLGKTSGVGGEGAGHPFVLELALAPGAFSLLSSFLDLDLSH